MSAELSFLIALGIVLAVSALVVLVLVRPLRRVLCDLLGSADRASLLTVFGGALLILVPLICAFVEPVERQPHGSTLFVIVEQLKWPMLGLIATILILALGVGFCIPPTQPISRVQFDELQRVLVKIQELRARELLSKLDALAPDHPGDRTPVVDTIVRLRDVHEHGTEIP